jgi:hypothetical protein
VALGGGLEYFKNVCTNNVQSNCMQVFVKVFF